MLDIGGCQTSHAKKKFKYFDETSQNVLQKLYYILTTIYSIGNSNPNKSEF